MASLPNYAGTMTTSGDTLTTANGGTRAAPTNGKTIFTAGALGALVQRVTINALATVVAGSVIIYKVNSGGSVYRFYTEIQLTPQTLTTGTATITQTLEAVDNPNLIPIGLAANETLYAVLTVSQTGIAVGAEGGSF